MKRICLAALTGALSLSTLAVAIDIASAAPRHGVNRAGVNRAGMNRAGVNRVGVNGVGVNRVGVNRVGINGVGVNRVGYNGRYGYNGYYRPGVRLAAGAALATTVAYNNNGYYNNGYYDNGYNNASYDTGTYETATYDNGYSANRHYVGDAFASTADHTGVGDVYTLRGNVISEADAVAYCARRFRSYDVASQTYLTSSGERASCPVQ